MLKMSAEIQKLGDGLGLVLSEEILRAASFRANEAVELLADEEGIRIQKVSQMTTLDELFEKYNGTYHCQEINTGEPVGSESW